MTTGSPNRVVVEAMQIPGSLVWIGAASARRNPASAGTVPTLKWIIKSEET